MNKEKLPIIPGTTSYLTDPKFYALWKYTHSNRLMLKSVCDFEDLAGMGTHRDFASMSLLWLLRDIGINKFDGLVFHTNIYKQYSGKEYERLIEVIKDKPEATAIQNLKKVLEGKILDLNVDELQDILMISHTYGLSEFFEFSKPKGPIKKKLDEYTNEYLNLFIKDSLLKDRHNYYNFQKQKWDLLQKIKFGYHKYGSSFIFYHPNIESVGINPESLPIHTIAALEYLGFLEVERIWIFDMDLPPEEQTEQYRIKINLKPKLIEAFNPISNFDKVFDTAPKTQPAKSSVLKPLLTAEGRSGYFKFYKQGLKIPVGNIDKRKYKLLECLIDPLGTAKTIDEVFNAIEAEKDSKNAELKNTYLATTKKLDIIQYTIKELQKVEGLKGKIALGISSNRRSVWLKLDS